MNPLNDTCALTDRAFWDIFGSTHADAATPEPTGCEEAAQSPAFTEPPSDVTTLSDRSVARERLGAALPSGGLVEAWLKAVLPLTSAPAEFHIIAILAAMGAMLGNRIVLWRHGNPVYPALWVVLVAPSTVFHKSTVMNLAKRMVARVAPLATLPNDFTTEALLRVLSTRPAGIAVVDEFGGQLTSSARDYNTSLKSVLMALWDGEDFSREAIKNPATVRRPALTLLSGTTQETSEFYGHWVEGRTRELGASLTLRLMGEYDGLGRAMAEKGDG